jgi:hypothetical protein
MRRIRGGSGEGWARRGTPNESPASPCFGGPKANRTPPRSRAAEQVQAEHRNMLFLTVMERKGLAGYAIWSRRHLTSPGIVACHPGGAAG